MTKQETINDEIARQMGRMMIDLIALQVENGRLQEAVGQPVPKADTDP